MQTIRMSCPYNTEKQCCSESGTPIYVNSDDQYACKNGDCAYVVQLGLLRLIERNTRELSDRT